jgi:hypothetical protein
MGAFEIAGKSVSWGERVVSLEGLAGQDVSLNFEAKLLAENRLLEVPRPPLQIGFDLQPKIYTTDQA